MSWVEKLSTKMKITTGDGNVYEPLYTVMDNKYSFDYNISEFEFPEISGTRVDKRLPKGRRFPLVLYFQGEDNLDQTEAFRISSNNLNPWIVLHPVFGQIKGHPLSLAIDSSKVNVSKITVTVVETIDTAGPRTIADPIEQALNSIDTTRESNNTATSEDVIPEISDVTQMNSNIVALYNDGSGVIGDTEIAADYFNLFNQAQTALNVALNDFNSAVNAVNAFIIYPAQFVIGVRTRLNIIKTQSVTLSKTLVNIVTPNEKKLYESQKTALISAAIETTLINVTDDYKSAVDVLFIIDEVLTLYNDYIDELQELQTIDGIQVDSYQPDAQSLFDLNFATNYAVSNLFAIALSAEQERIIILEADSNVITQAHRFYGLVEGDLTIDRFIETNNIEFREYLQIKKGRTIKYYV